ncbi:MAG TPA: ATP-binding protein, partial [Anaerolineales bacterium]|nr:ATP-binding protein [Anaerolineales bacterium]
LLNSFQTFVVKFLMQTIRTRLSLNYLLVLILGMLLASVLVWLAVERLYVNTQRENLLAQAHLIATALQGTTLPTGPIQPYSQTSNTAPGIHTRLLSEGGAVIVGLPLSEAFTQVPAAEQYASIPTSELIQRPEIGSALRGTPATAIRRVLGNQRVLYAAEPVYGDNGQISGIVYIATPLPASGLPANIILQLIGAIVIAVLLATLAGSLLGRKIARPLERLVHAAAAISKGELKQRVEIESGIRELHSLSNTFNDMAESLHRSDEAQRAFIADVTHELRTPLTVIKGTIETLEDGALDDLEGRGPLLTSMGRETERLIRLVNELLVLTRADAGSLKLNLQPVDLAELARARCDVFSRLATRRGIILKVNDDFGVRQLATGTLAYPLVISSSPGVLADPDRLCQVLDNLLDNAIRHSPENSTITVTIKPANAGVECSISDQGPGIPAEHLPFIFERFYRVDAARDRKDGGTGLGLAIARTFVNAQGGHISAQSVESQGTTIIFWLPKD